MKNPLLLSLILLFLNINHSFGQWRQANNGLEGGWISDFLIDKSDTFATSYYNVYKKSITGTWIATHKDPFYRIYRLVKNGDELFVTAETGVYKSNDSGVSWTSIATNIYTVRDILTQSNKIYLASRNGVYKSIDDGKTWTAINDGFNIPIPEIYRFFLFDNTIFCATSSGIYYLTPGEKWQSIDDLHNTSFRDLVIKDKTIYALSSDAQIFKLTQGNNIWSLDKTIHTGLTLISRLMLMTDSLIVATASGVFATTSEGESWTMIGDALPESYISASYSYENKLYVGQREGIHIADKITGKWSNWSIDNNGLDAGQVDNFFAQNGKLYATSSSGIYSGGTDGANWTKIDTFSSSHGVANTKTIFIASNGLYKSNDGGATFLKDKDLDDISTISALTVKGDTVLGTFSKSKDNLFISFTNGNSWKLINFNTPPNNYYISCVAINNGKIYIIASNKIYKTSNFGKDWIEVALPLNSGSLNFIKFINNTLYFGDGYTGMYKSGNEGNSWSLVFNHNGASDFVFDNNQMFVLNGSGSIEQSEDNGATWKNGDSGLASSRIISFPIFLHNNTLFANIYGDKSIWYRPVSDFTAKIKSFLPGSGFVGDKIVINGNYFSPVAELNKVNFNGEAATVTSASSTSITVLIPEKATTGKISVTAGNQTAASENDFTVEHIVTALPSENIEKETITFFPNPTTNSIVVHDNIDHQTMAIVVYNSIGQPLKRVEVMNETDTIVDLSPFQDGAYIIKVNTGTRTVVKRVLKK